MNYSHALLAITLCLPVTFPASARGEDVLFENVRTAVPLGFATGALAGVIAAQKPQATAQYISGAIAVNTVGSAAMNVRRPEEAYTGFMLSTVLSTITTACGFVAGFILTSTIKSIF